MRTQGDETVPGDGAAQPGPDQREEGLHCRRGAAARGLVQRFVFIQLMISIAVGLDFLFTKARRQHQPSPHLCPSR